MRLFCTWSTAVDLGLLQDRSRKLIRKRIEGSEATTAKSSLLFVCGGLV